MAPCWLTFAAQASSRNDRNVDELKGTTRPKRASLLNIRRGLWDFVVPGRFSPQPRYSRAGAPSTPILPYRKPLLTPAIHPTVGTNPRSCPMLHPSPARMPS